MRQEALRRSLRRQAQLLQASLPLTPVDSYAPQRLPADAQYLAGMYATDKMRSKDDMLRAKILFAGRRRTTRDVNEVAGAWARALQAGGASLRVLSGLHAHVVLFMAIGNIGDAVLLLPERAGGHMSTRAILTRLGYHVIEICTDDRRQGIDLRATLRRAGQRPRFVFIDRSEGLVYEDFGPLVRALPDAIAVFDASQYLPQIMAGRYPHPFDMGFGLVLASLHKSFPGPQKAVLATREDDQTWRRIQRGMSTYVSSYHVEPTYAAGAALSATCAHEFTERLIETTLALEGELVTQGMPVVARPSGEPTQHVWVRCSSHREALRAFSDLERVRVLTNFRSLPYGLGHGLRIGTTYLTGRGLKVPEAISCARILAAVVKNGFSLAARHEVRRIAERITYEGRREGYSVDAALH